MHGCLRRVWGAPTLGVLDPGGYLGGRLIQSGVSVTFLVRAQKAEQLAGHGLRLTSQFGDWEDKVNAITAEDRAGAAYGVGASPGLRACPSLNTGGPERARPDAGSRTISPRNGA